MQRRCSGRGLMFVGALVAGIGLLLVVGESFHLPPHWRIVALGVILFAVGALRWATRRPDDSTGGDTR